MVAGTDGAATYLAQRAEVYTKAEKVLNTTLEITRRTDLQASEVFHEVIAFIGRVKAFLGGTYHGHRRIHIVPRMVTI